MIESQYDKVFN
jgi:hypothetical protein